MSTSDDLAILQLRESQTNKATTVNEMFRQIEHCLSKRFVIDADVIAGPGDNSILLPFDFFNDLGDRSGLHAILYVVTGDPVHDFSVFHPPYPHFFLIKNETAMNVNLENFGNDNINIPANGNAIVYSYPGTGLTDLTASFTIGTVRQVFDYNLAYNGTPSNDEVVSRWFFPRSVTFPANFAGAKGRVYTPPQNTQLYEVKQNDTVIGTVGISIAGLFTFATVNGDPITIVPEDFVTIVAPAPADGTISGIYLTLPATAQIGQ